MSSPKGFFVIEAPFDFENKSGGSPLHCMRMETKFVRVRTPVMIWRARSRARWERFPSASACRRQAIGPKTINDEENHRAKHASPRRTSSRSASGHSSTMVQESQSKPQLATFRMGLHPLGWAFTRESYRQLSRVTMM
jgi:hypothetical protein